VEVMDGEIDGAKVLSEADFHRELVRALNFAKNAPYYGRNLDALWDIMTGGLERPVHIVWRNSNISKAAMPEKFQQIVGMLKRVEEHDKKANYNEIFGLSLE
jgi:ribonuclease inhibitor